ncbi:hypothetical protein WN55_03451 [Dufourea novaeangliae]|uniref:Uncharacterized protein n=1 Tax=Dufourea novaeangliae TaxID=178035 RepID=A0A154PJE6_DUFNO|nr:hypothetical protein WN55_03451 [Dufourea novaeangliae]
MFQMVIALRLFTCDTVSSTEADTVLQRIVWEIFLETTSLTLLNRLRAESTTWKGETSGLLAAVKPAKFECNEIARLFLRYGCVPLPDVSSKPRSEPTSPDIEGSSVICSCHSDFSGLKDIKEFYFLCLEVFRRLRTRGLQQGWATSIIRAIHFACSRATENII